MTNQYTKEKLFNRSLKLNYDEFNISFEVFYRELSSSELSIIEEEVKDAVKLFQERFFSLDKSPHIDKRKKIKIYVFKNRPEFVRLGPYLAVSVNNGGITYTTLEENFIRADIYVYMHSKTHNLRHEIVHALMADVLANLPLSLVEGIADYIEYGGQDVSRSRLQEALLKLEGKSSLKSILEIDYKQDHLVYYGGLLLVAFFEKNFPDYIDRLLNDIAQGEPRKIDSEAYEEKFKEWLHSIGVGVTDKDAYLVKPSNRLRGRIYEATVVDTQGYDVGYFPLLEHMFLGNTFRVSCPGTKDYYDVRHQFTFMKLLFTDGRFWGMLCDKEGSDYYVTAEFLRQTNRMFKEKLVSTKQVEHLQKLIRGQNVWSRELAALHQNLDECKIVELKDIEKRLESSGWIDYLKYIDLTSLDQRELQEAHKNGERLRIETSSKPDKHKMYAAASVYRDVKKIGELGTGTSYFVKDEHRCTFVHRDSSTNLHIQFNETCYVTKHDGGLHFVSGMTVSQPPGIRVNPLFKLDPCYLNSTEYFERLQPNIELAPTIDLVDSEYKIERGKLLDCKGTSREFDDVYEAILTKGNTVVTVLRYVGMYSIEDTLIVENFGKGQRYQLPSNARWLKLVEDEQRMRYLVPYIRDSGKIWDEALFLDPSIVHTYDNGQKSGLVDIATFENGTIFECRAKEGTVELYTADGSYVGQMVSEQHTFMGKLFLSADYNYSYTDFMTSKHPNIIPQDDYFRYTFGEGDYSTNKEYSTHQRIYVNLQ